VYEAEQFTLAGAARVCHDHLGFEGDGFVCGFGREGAGNSSITARVRVAEGGPYRVTLRYANGMPAAMTLSVYVNGAKATQTSLPSLGTWELWGDKEETLQFLKGANTLSYRFELSDTGNVNLDEIIVRRVANRLTHDVLQDRSSGQPDTHPPSELTRTTATPLSSELDGLEADEVRRRLGTPSLVQRETGFEIWYLDKSIGTSKIYFVNGKSSTHLPR
jgi:hypothetical protein